MPRFSLISLRYAGFCLASMTLFSPISNSVSAQQRSQNQNAPYDPKELMLQSAKINGLADSQVPPWHLKATFQVLDREGHVTDSGTYEELWAAPTHYKRTIATSTFTQTDYATEKGVFRSGRSEQPPMLINDLHREIVDPTLNPQTIAHDSFSSTSLDLNSDELTCLMIADTASGPDRVWCVQSGDPVLRKTTSTREALEVFRDRIVPFHGYFIPGEMRFVQSGKLALTAHLESIEPLDASLNLDPSPDAVPLHRRINVSAGVAVGMLKKHDAPVYPPDVKMSGRVALIAIIGVDGHVQELRVMSGPPMLQQAALDAVRHWTYRPFLLNNEPVEVMTQINIDFNR